MSRVKSFAVGHGDMFYIRHNSDNFTIIDCCLSEDNQERIIGELHEHSSEKGVTRFISTHPDDDHFRGIKYLDENFGIRNFYCVKNSATKVDDTDDFLHYCALRDGEKAYYISKGCKRRWMNVSDEARKKAGVHIYWPDTANADFREALELAGTGGSPNNISAIIRYGVEDGATFLWLGDLETDFMERIAEHVKLPQTDIVFASHHGRHSGRIPHVLLDQLKPKIIVLGEAPSRHLHYYGDYHTLTQNSAGDLTFECDEDRKVHIFCSEPDYEVDFLGDESADGEGSYLGTLNLEAPI